MPGGEGLVRLVSTITMSPCSSVGAIESPLIVISRNPSAGAAVIRRRSGAGKASAPSAPAGSNAAIPTDGLSVGSVVLARFTGITIVWYHGGFTFRPARQLNHGPALRYVVLMDDMRPVMGGYIDVGEWRCLNFGMGPFVNRGSWIGLFVRIA